MQTMQAIPSIQDIVEAARSLRPERAVQFKNGDLISLCTTPVYEAILQDGKVTHLTKREGRYGAGYVRVSTPSQRSGKDERGGADGFSELDQIARIVHHFVARGEAFRIFSDAGLSGGLSIMDATLTEHLLRVKAERFHSVYTRIFLSPAVSGRYSEREINQMKQWRDARVEDIKAGRITKKGQMGELTSALSDEEPQGAKGAKVGGKKSTTKAHYRPGLTTLVRYLQDIHTVAITDLSRIARSSALSLHVFGQMRSANTDVHGLVEHLDYLNGERGGRDIATLVLTWMAEHRLEEVLIQVIRGQVAMLESGRPHSLLQFWLTRDKNGFAKLNEREKVIRRLVELFLETGRTTTTMTMLQNEGVPAPGKHGRGGQIWSRNTVIETLRRPALKGVQVIYGREWRVLPPIIDDETWERIQKMLDVAASARPPQRRRADAYLATSLIKCRCGKPLSHFPHSSGHEWYQCSMPHAEKKFHGTLWQHVILDAQNVEAFLNDLMRTDPEAVLAPFRSTVERNRVQEDIERLRREKTEIDTQLPGEQERADQIARERLRPVGLDNNREVVDALIRDALAPLFARRQTVEAEIRERQEKLQSLIPGDLADMEERVRAWGSLNTYTKNGLLRTFFAEFRYVGTYPEPEYLIPVLRTLTHTELPHIPIKVKAKGRTRIRRLVTVGEWFDSMLPKISP